jgi:hypothetical protein
MPTYFRRKVHQTLQKTHTRLKWIKKKRIISFIRRISYSNILQINYWFIDVTSYSTDLLYFLLWNTNLYKIKFWRTTVISTKELNELNQTEFITCLTIPNEKGANLACASIYCLQNAYLQCQGCTTFYYRPAYLYLISISDLVLHILGFKQIYFSYAMWLTIEQLKKVSYWNTS